MNTKIFFAVGRASMLALARGSQLNHAEVARELNMLRYSSFVANHGTQACVFDVLGILNGLLKSFRILPKIRTCAGHFML
jgi:hypothetical protein